MPFLQLRHRIMNYDPKTDLDKKVSCFMSFIKTGRKLSSIFDICWYFLFKVPFQRWASICLWFVAGNSVITGCYTSNIYKANIQFAFLRWNVSGKLKKNQQDASQTFCQAGTAGFIPSTLDWKGPYTDSWKNVSSSLTFSFRLWIVDCDICRHSDNCPWTISTAQ